MTGQHIKTKASVWLFIKNSLYSQEDSTSISHHPVSGNNSHLTDNPLINSWPHFMNKDLNNGGKWVMFLLFVCLQNCIFNEVVLCWWIFATQIAWPLFGVSIIWLSLLGWAFTRSLLLLFYYYSTKPFTSYSSIIIYYIFYSPSLVTVV
jgi:hypothetical protein